MSLLSWLGITAKARAYIRVGWQAFDSGFHLSAQKSARRRGLRGWMRVVHQPMTNYLEMEVEAREAKIRRFLLDLRQAPGNPRAQQAQVQWKTYRSLYKDFRVRS